MYEQDQKIPIFCLLNKYVGDWKEGEKHGQGTYYFSWGGELVGEFKENKPWNVTEYVIGLVISHQDFHNFLFSKEIADQSR